MTFDAGGLNLKSTGFIEEMHMDMGGAAAVLGAMHIIAQLGLKKNVGEWVLYVNESVFMCLCVHVCELKCLKEMSKECKCNKKRAQFPQ